MKIGVFCSANSNLDPDFFRLTHELGEWIGRNGHTLVYGGCNLGLMECVAQATSAAGGRVVGVIPRLLLEGEHASDVVDVTIHCERLSDRKDLMLIHSDVAIALPGGLGTLDEIFSMVGEATLAYHHKRVIVYNMKGFWDSLEALLADLGRQGMLRGDISRHIVFATSLDDVVKYLSQIS